MEVSLKDVLGKIKSDHKEVFDNAQQGVAPSGDWANAGDLPLELEYRVVVDSASYGNSKASGNPQITLVYKVLEPAEFAGKKLSDYQSPNPTTPIGTEVLAKTLGALQANLDDLDGGWPKFVQQFEGRTAVIALRVWGQDNDRLSVRYINADRGQELSTTVKPKAARQTGNLRPQPEINIPKGEPFPDTPAVTPPVTPPAASNPATPPNTGGVNLPPGLRSN